MGTGTSGKTAALQSLDSAISDFQAFAGLEQTGELDEETVKMMHTPRCGVKDFVEEDEDTPRSESQNAVEEQQTPREALRTSGIALEGEGPDVQGVQVPGQEQVDQEGGGRHHEEGVRHLGEGDRLEVHKEEQRQSAHRDQIRASIAW